MPQDSILARILRLNKVLVAALVAAATMGGNSVAATLAVEGQPVDYGPSAEGPPFALFHVEQKGYRNGYTLDCARRQFLWTSNVELASGQATANTAGAQWRPITGDSKIAHAVFLAICGELGVTGTLDEIFPTNDFSATLDSTNCGGLCKVTVNGWAVELARVVVDDQGTPAFTLRDAGGQCGMGGCKALFLKRSGYWDHVFEVGGTLFDVLPTRTNGLADLQVRTLGSSGWTNVKYAWDGKRYSEAKPSPEPPPVAQVAVAEAGIRAVAGPIAAPMRATSAEGSGSNRSGTKGFDGATAVPASPEADRARSDVIEVKDGSVLTGAIETQQVSFRSAFGNVDVNLTEIHDFTDGTLRLADGSVLKGRFGSGTIAVATARGNLKVALQDVVRIARGAEAHSQGVAAPASRPATGQGMLTGRVVDNFGQPVAAARVQILGANLSSQSDHDGRYQLPYVPGDMVVRVEHTGYDPAEFPLRLAQPASYPVEDKMLVRHPPGGGVYLWGERNWVSLAPCQVVQVERDSREIQKTETSRYIARGKPASIVVAGPAVFLNASGSGSGLLLYRVQDDDTIIRVTRRAGLGGVLEEVSSTGPAGDPVKLEQRKIGANRPVYEGALAPGVYAFVDRVSAATGACFKFEITTAGQALRQRAQQDAAKALAGAREPTPPAIALTAGDAQSEAALNLDRDQRRQVQSWLNALGLSPGSLDGSFGGGTRKALSAFQRSVHVAETGYLSDSQYQHLRSQGGKALGAETARAIEVNLVSIPGGCFHMGSPPSEMDREEDEGPQHQVCVKPFGLSRFEVTVSEFAAFVAATGYLTDAERNAGGKTGCYTIDLMAADQHGHRHFTNWRQPHKYQANRDDHPVSCVSWNDTKAFISWLNDVGGGGFRLPTSAEWEYAARAGTQTARFWGNDPSQACRFANVADRTEFRVGQKVARRDAQHACSDGQYWAAPVGSYKANPWGLYDIIGNVGERTEDCGGGSYAGASSDGAAFVSSDCGSRESRGGSFPTEPRYARVSDRTADDPSQRYFMVGFRVARGN